MTNSMTAYAQAKTDTELGELSCELRSVNHRYLEVAPKMPEELRVHEGALRELVSKKVGKRPSRLLYPPQRKRSHKPRTQHPNG